MDQKSEAVHYSWMSGTETMTIDEPVEWELVDGEVVLKLPGWTDAWVYMNRKQAMDMICGLSYLVNQMPKENE